MASKNVKFSLLVLSLFIATVLTIEQPRFKTESRIVGGRNSIKGQFPYYVLLFEYETFQEFCGGSIITEFHILSAAHCFTQESRQKSENVAAAFGFSQSDDNITLGLIESIAIHENFDPEIFINDIALLRTVHEIVFTELIKPIPIVQSNIVDTKRLQGTLCGLGLIHLMQDGEKILPETLQYLRTEIIPKTECRSEYDELYYRNHKNWSRVMAMLDGKTFCAKNELRVGPLLGDSGGPLFANGFLVGIVSASVGHALKYPTLYTNVYKHLSWILSELNRFGYIE